MTWTKIPTTSEAWANQSVLYVLGGYVVQGYIEELGTSSVVWSELPSASTIWTDV